MKLQPIVAYCLLLASCSGPNDRLVNGFVRETRDMVMQSEQAQWTEEADSLLILEAYDVQIGQVYGTIWSPQQSINFERASGQPVIDQGAPFFSDFVLDRLAKWDTVSVRTREIDQGALLDGSYVAVELQIREHGRTRIRRFGFEEFLDALRDPNSVSVRLKQ